LYSLALLVSIWNNIGPLEVSNFYKSKVKIHRKWLLNMGATRCPETSVNANQRSVTPQKSEDLIYTAAEAWNHVCHLLLSLHMRPANQLTERFVALCQSFLDAPGPDKGLFVLFVLIFSATPAIGPWPLEMNDSQSHIVKFLKLALVRPLLWPIYCTNTEPTNGNRYWSVIFKEIL
jgi:hypothetical protein